MGVCTRVRMYGIYVLCVSLSNTHHALKKINMETMDQIAKMEREREGEEGSDTHTQSYIPAGARCEGVWVNSDSCLL